MIRLIALIFVSALALAQQSVRIDGFPVREPAKRFKYDGSGNVTHVCITTPFGPWNNRSVPATYSWTIAGSTLTSIVDSSNTSTVTTASAHGLQVGNSITIAGVTGDTDLNGTYVILTVPTSTTFTITTANVTDATYNASGTSVSTTAPRSTAAIWAVQKIMPNTSGEGSIMWAGGAATSYTFICDNYATLSYQ